MKYSFWVFRSQGLLDYPREQMYLVDLRQTYGKKEIQTSTASLNNVVLGMVYNDWLANPDTSTLSYLRTVGELNKLKNYWIFIYFYCYSEKRIYDNTTVNWTLQNELLFQWLLTLPSCH